MATLILTLILLTQLWGWNIEIKGWWLLYVIMSALLDLLIYLWLLHWLFVFIGLLPY